MFKIRNVNYNNIILLTNTIKYTTNQHTHTKSDFFMGGDRIQEKKNETVKKLKLANFIPY